MSPDPPPDTLVSRAAGLAGAAGVLLIGILAFRLSLPLSAPTITAPPAERGMPCSLQPDGYLRGRFYGAVSLTADWSGNGLRCDGMQRPDGQGIRLFFAGDRQGGGQISMVIAIDGHPDALVGAERPANVTVIDERESRFFSTGGADRCWAMISSVAALARSRSDPPGHRIDGRLYCLGALPSLSDRTSLTLGEFSFAGRISIDEGQG
jgi:hypothetical protein